MKDFKDSKQLIEDIQQQYTRLSKGQKLIAEYILKNYDKAAFMTASKLGEKVTLKALICDSDEFLEEETDVAYTLVGILSDKKSNIEHFYDEAITKANKIPAAFVTKVAVPVDSLDANVNFCSTISLLYSPS